MDTRVSIAAEGFIEGRGRGAEAPLYHSGCLHFSLVAVPVMIVVQVVPSFDMSY